MYQAYSKLTVICKEDFMTEMTCFLKNDYEKMSLEEKNGTNMVLQMLSDILQYRKFVFIDGLNYIKESNIDMHKYIDIKETECVCMYQIILELNRLAAIKRKSSEGIRMGSLSKTISKIEIVASRIRFFLDLQIRYEINNILQVKEKTKQDDMV